MERECELDEVKEKEFEVLFEYKGSRKEIVVTPNTLCTCIEQELHALGEAEAVVSVSNAGNCDDSSDRMFLLQKWSTKWDAYVKIEVLEEIQEHDKVSVTRKPVVSPKVSS